MTIEAGSITAEQASGDTREQFVGAGDGNRISNVLVFPEQAYVTREAKVSVASGLNRLLLEVNAFRVDPDAVQARVYGRGELLGVQYREVPTPEAPQEGVRELEEKLRELDQGRARLTDERAALTKQETFLDSIVSFAETQVREDIQTKFPETENLKGLVDFLGENYGVFYRQRQGLNEKTAEMDREIDAEKRKLQSPGQAREYEQEGHRDHFQV